MIQAITYEEFLPTFGIILKPFVAYNPFVRPDITNIFATAAYRFGHSVVTDNILLKNNQCRAVGVGELTLLEGFFNPSIVNQYGVDIILKGLVSHEQYDLDLKVNSVLRNMLFGDPRAAVVGGLDLVSLNIQRGRDHGLPHYNKIRQFYTGTVATKLSDINCADSITNRLRTLYGNVDNIDPWVGLLAEKRLLGKTFGKTLYAILKTQFENLRDGDFYSYLNDPYLDITTKYTIKKTRFIDVVKRNTNLTNLPANIFMVSECPTPIAARQEKEENLLTISPNPVQDQDILTLSIGKKLNMDATIQLFSAQGSLMKMIPLLKDAQIVQVETDNLAPGVYIISLITNGQAISKKFVKMAD